MLNCRIGGGGSLLKRCGYSAFYTAANAVRGCWYGPVAGGEDALYLCAGSKLLRVGSDGTASTLGYVTAGVTGACALFAFSGKLYILDGSEYYRWDGTTFSLVEGYIPVVLYSSDPTSTGSVYEPVNLLTNKVVKRMASTSSSIVRFYLNAVYSEVCWVKVNGVATSAYTTAVYTYSGGAKTYVELSAAPGTGAIVTVCYRDTSISLAENRRTVTCCRRAALYGRNNTTHALLWGRSAGEVVPSEYEDGSVRSAEYFPVGKPFMVGDGTFPVTSMIRQYDCCMAFTSDAAWLLTQEETAADNGLLSHDYRIVTLNESIGSIGAESAKQIENEPFSVARDGIYRWEETEVLGERNASLISAPITSRIAPGFTDSALTLHDRGHGEFWVYDQCGLWVYDYRRSIWYSFSGITPDGFVDFGGVAGFWNGNTVYRFDSSLMRDCGAVYDSVYTYADSALGDETSMKAVDRLFVSLSPGSGSLIPTIESDRGVSVELPGVCCGASHSVTNRRRVKLPRAVRIRLSLANSLGAQCEVESCSIGYRTVGEAEIVI